MNSMKEMIRGVLWTLGGLILALAGFLGLALWNLAASLNTPLDTIARIAVFCLIVGLTAFVLGIVQFIHGERIND